jgi:hypothetical protein
MVIGMGGAAGSGRDLCDFLNAVFETAKIASFQLSKNTTPWLDKSRARAIRKTRVRKEPL